MGEDVILDDFGVADSLDTEALLPSVTARVSLLLSLVSSSGGRISCVFGCRNLPTVSVQIERSLRLCGRCVCTFYVSFRAPKSS